MSKPETVFPFTRKFGGFEYTMSLDTPDFTINCSEGRARKTVLRLRTEGWAARFVRYKTVIGDAFIVYERRTGREMRPKKGHKSLY
jgi:hypothetical protein